MKTFFVGIKGVIIKDDKVLIIKAGQGKDYWEVPGGRIDDDESIAQTLARELKEELPNISSVNIDKVLDAYRIPRDVSGNLSLVLIFYKVNAEFNGNPQLSEEHIDWQWASAEEALEKVHESCRQAIKNAFE